MTDQEKINEAYFELLRKPARFTTMDIWRLAVIWRDKNPGPHVAALVEALKWLEMNQDGATKRENKMTISSVLAQFEKAISSEI